MTGSAPDSRSRSVSSAPPAGRDAVMAGRMFIHALMTRLAAKPRESEWVSLLSDEVDQMVNAWEAALDELDVARLVLPEWADECEAARTRDSGEDTQ